MTAPQLSPTTTTNRITTSGYAYDANGNLTDDSLHEYTYDAENRLVTLDSTAATYTYDGGNLRVKKQVGSTTTVYIFSGSKVIAEYMNGSLSKEYIYSGSQLVATIAGSTTTYSHGDHLSVRLRRDDSGNLVGSSGHLPFGDIWYETGTADKWKFTSYERGAANEGDLDYAIFRFDSWRLGRFMSPDRVAGNTGDPQSLNRYSYVNGDPINLIDPLGLDEHSLNCMWDENRGCIAQAPGGGSTGFGSDCGYGTLSEILSASSHGGSDAFRNAVYGDANAIDTMQGHYFSLLGKANPIAQGIAVHQGMIDTTRYQATNPPKGGYYDIIVYCGGHDLSSFVCLPPPEAMPGSQPFIVGPIFQSQFRLQVA